MEALDPEVAVLIEQNGARVEGKNLKQTTYTRTIFFHKRTEPQKGGKATTGATFRPNSVQNQPDGASHRLAPPGKHCENRTLARAADEKMNGIVFKEIKGSRRSNRCYD